MADGFHCARQFRSDGHHAYRSSADIPELIELLRRRGNEIFRRMHSAFRMTDKRPFEMNAQRNCTVPVLGYTRDGLAKMLERPQQTIVGRRNGCRQISGDPVLGHSGLNGCQSIDVGFHYIVSGAAVNMDINEPGRKHHAGKIKMLCVGRQISLGA